jgi:lipopolysaccharide/colanic/teichoic acid biosynthesis glycosyltransferase
MKKDATALSLASHPSTAHAPNLELRIGVPRYGHLAVATKRAMDVLAALMVGTLGAPLILLIAAAVKLTSRGPVLFRQVRLGKDGVPFTFYKFRTMHHGNDDSVHRSFCENFINGGMNRDERRVFKMVEDPRVTAVGGLLRKTSLDELPQFWNVLRGEMSLVGPRPPISYEIEHYQDWHKDRLQVKPGLTGLWQVSGRSTVPFNEMVMLDLHYITHWSLALDLRIIWKTLPVMVRGEGAY